MEDQRIYQAKRIEAAKVGQMDKAAPLRLGGSAVVGLLLLRACLEELSLPSPVPIEIESTDSRTLLDKLREGSIEDAKQSIVKRLGISVLPRLALTPELETGAIKALQIGETGRYRPFYVSVRKSHALSAGAEELISIAIGTNRKEKAATRG